MVGCWVLGVCCLEIKTNKNSIINMKDSERKPDTLNLDDLTVPIETIITKPKTCLMRRNQPIPKVTKLF